MYNNKKIESIEIAFNNSDWPKIFFLVGIMCGATVSPAHGRIKPHQ